MKILEIICDCNELVFESYNEQICGKLMKKTANHTLHILKLFFIEI